MRRRLLVVATFNQENPMEHMDIVKAIAQVYPVLEAVAAERGAGAAAVALAEAGIKVFPTSAGPHLHDGNETKGAKAPLSGSGFTHGHNDATTDLPKVSTAWRRWPDAMVGVPAMLNGVFVVDVDRPKWDEQKQCMTPDGLDTIKAWEQEHGPLPDTLRVRTPSDGLHLYFQLPDNAPLSSVKDYDGIDTRAKGYVIAPGSRTAEGKRYVLENPGAEVEPMPQWLLDLLRNPPRKQQYDARAAAVQGSAGGPRTASSGGGYSGRACWRGPDGWTNYGRKSVAGAEADMEAAAPTTRHKVILSRARHIGEVMAKGHIPSSEEAAIVSRLTDAAMRSGHEPRDCVNSVRDGIRLGLENPAAPDVPDVEDAPSWWGVAPSIDGLGPSDGYQKGVGSERPDWDDVPQYDDEMPMPASPKEATSAPDWRSLSGADFDGYDCRRGLTKGTCERFGLGYIEEVVEGGVTAWMRIPTGPQGSGAYVLEDVRSAAEVVQGYEREAKRVVPRYHVFNKGAFWTARRPVFVVMDEVDALSILDVGGEAVAIGHPSTVEPLLKELRRLHPDQPVVLSLGVGETETKAAATLEEGLRKAKVKVYRFDLAGGLPDVNAVLTYDRAALERSVAAMKDADSIEDAIRQLALERIRQDSAAAAMEDFFDRLQARAGECVPTGFAQLDALLDGGLYPGLYSIGAISGLGKTTFALQIADNAAAAGRHVLIFSLEMDRDELMAKSLSRLTYLNNAAVRRPCDRGLTSSKTTRGIMNARNWGAFSDSEWDAIHQAKSDYLAFADHVHITVGVGDVGIGQVRAKVKEYSEALGEAPLVIIDYMQILAAVDPKRTDKQNVDYSVVELKRISRDFHTPVIGVSSFNRENYAASVNLAAFKESGAIEYTSDCIIGIQYAGLEDRANETEGDRRERRQRVFDEVDRRSALSVSQDVQVKVLKNRNGRRGSVYFTLSNAFNTYTEAEDQEAASKKAASSATTSSSDGWKTVGSTAPRRPKKSKHDGIGSQGDGESLF